MKKIVSSFVASIALVSALSANDFYASIDGDEITKQDISMALQDPRIDFDKLPDTAKKQVLEQIVNRKLLAKKQLLMELKKTHNMLKQLQKLKRI